jgi:hypothetical protein
MLINYLMRYHEADKGNVGSGATTEPEKSDDGTGNKQTDEKLFSQAELDAHIKDRLARQKSQFESQQQKTKDEAEQRKLEEEKRFQELAEQRQKELDAIKPKAEQVDTYEKLVNDLLIEQKKDLPKPILVLLDKLSPADQVAYLKENKAEIVKQSTSHDINAGNRNAGKPTAAEQLEQKKLELSKRGGYTRY